MYKETTVESHLLQFGSSTLSAEERRYSLFEQEARSIVFAMKKFRHYLLENPLVAFNDR